MVEAPDDEMGEVPMHAVVPRLSGTPGPAAQPGAGGRPAQPRDLRPHRLLRRAHRRARAERGHLTMAVPRARRSSLILPVNVPRFVEKAYARGADAIVLDLEDSVPPQEKASARKLVRDSLAARRPRRRRGAGPREQRPGPARRRHRRRRAPRARRPVDPQGGIGRADPRHRRADRAPGARAGPARPGTCACRSPSRRRAGSWPSRRSRASSDRIATMSIGVEDYCLELGVEPSADGLELLYPVARLVTVCKAVGVQPTGLVGSIAGFRDLATFEARRPARAPARLRGRRLHPSRPGDRAEPRVHARSRQGRVRAAGRRGVRGRACAAARRP